MAASPDSLLEALNRPDSLPDLPLARYEELRTSAGR